MPSGLYDARLDELKEDILMEAASVHHAMRSHVVCCGQDASVHDALELMFGHDVGVLPVVDDDKHVVGIVSDRDLARALFEAGQAPDGLPVARAMSAPVRSIGEHAPLRSAVEVLRAYHVRRLPVVDDQGRLVGLLSLDDIAREVAGGPHVKAADVTAALAAIMAEPH